MYQQKPCLFKKGPAPLPYSCQICSMRSFCKQLDTTLSRILEYDLINSEISGTSLF
ncbi:hypothetical protein PAHAL_1G138900 [Panicum hallii]|uniref:Uncharacterized protein n=1 Tax=Panicum hallii TaxID=206008 RepID=A0A2T8KV90_9POAL|nr:hypothetical protein PAHAL_1G138900 [Panicum hallii]